jgi:hypothetical protein
MMNPIVIQACAEELEKQADLSPELIGLLLGGAGGAGLGYAATDDPRKKTRNAILGGLGGALGGGILGGQIGGGDGPAAPAAPKPPADPLSMLSTARGATASAEDLVRKAHEAALRRAEALQQALAGGAQGVVGGAEALGPALAAQATGVPIR